MPPEIPTFEASADISPGYAAHADPGAFAAPGEALAHGARAATDAMRDFAQTYADARQQAEASDVNAGMSGKLQDAQFRWGKIADRQQALDGFNKEAAAIRADTLKTVREPDVANYVTRQFDQESVIRAGEVGRQAFALESSRRVGDLDANLQQYAESAAAANDDLLRAHIRDNAMAAIKGAVAGGWLPPQEGVQREIGFTSQMQEVRVRQVKDAALETQDPAAMQKLAQTLDDPSSFPGLLPEKREILAQGIDTSLYRLQVRAAAQQAHEDAQSDKALRRMQAHNEAVLLAGVNSGSVQLKDSDIEKFADSQQISSAGVEALHAARDRAEDGRDSPMASLQLWHEIDTGHATPDDIYTGMKSGYLSKTTATAMMKTLDSHSQRAQTAEEKNALTLLRTAISGSGDGSINLFGAAHDRAAQSLTEAESEFHTRMAGGEEPASVLTDMMPRYAPAITRPNWLSQPKAGAVSDMKSLNAVAAATVKQHHAGQMNDTDYGRQVELLNLYKKFYTLEEQAAAARAQAQKKIPKPAQGEGQ